MKAAPTATRRALRGAGFSTWRPARELAGFEAVDLGSFPSEHRLAQVWLAPRRMRVDVAEEPLRPQMPFGVRLTLEAPGSQFAAPELVKSVVDGTVAVREVLVEPGSAWALSGVVEELVATDEGRGVGTWATRTRKSALEPGDLYSGLGRFELSSAG